MAWYWAIIDASAPHIKRDVETGQLEVYEEKADAERRKYAGTEVVEVYIDKASET